MRNQVSLGALLLALSASCLSAQVAAQDKAQTQPTRTVHADLSKVTGPHSDVPLRVVGAGRAEEGLRADWQEQLATVER
jgi:xylan 1,4-beta-xylosidase